MFSFILIRFLVRSVYLVFRVFLFCVFSVDFRKKEVTSPLVAVVVQASSGGRGCPFHLWWKLLSLPILGRR